MWYAQSIEKKSMVEYNDLRLRKLLTNFITLISNIIEYGFFKTILLNWLQYHYKHWLHYYFYCYSYNLIIPNNSFNSLDVVICRFRNELTIVIKLRFCLRFYQQTFSICRSMVLKPTADEKTVVIKVWSKPCDRFLLTSPWSLFGSLEIKNSNNERQQVSFRENNL